jgi:hypothetical protein
MPPVNTKKADRRHLTLTSTADLRAELDRLEAAHAAGTLTTTGNWSPGRILSHLADWISYYYDGFPFSVPLPLRLIGPLFKRSMVSKGFRPGLPTQLPRGVKDADLDCTFEEGLARLRAQLDRIDAGRSLAGTSPFLGKVTHDEAIRIQLHHAEHHLGFLRTSE